MAERAVLHVLPHPGAGGERVVDLLEPMPGFRFERVHLTQRGKLRELPAGLRLARRAAAGADLLHVQGDAAAILCSGLIARRPSVISFQGLHLLRRARGARRRAVGLGLRRAIARSRAAICCSPSELDDARAIAGERLRDRLVLVENGVPLPGPRDPRRRAATRAELGLGEGEVAVLYVGALDERKGVLDLLEALGDLSGRPARVVGLLAGDGPLRTRVERALEEADLQVLGQRDDVEALMEAADVFVLPSEREGLSLALLEAMAAGLAPIVSDGPGNPDAVGDAGIVVPYGEDGALAEAIGRLASDPGERTRLGEAARARAEARFGAERMVAGVREVYLRALEGGDSA